MERPPEDTISAYYPESYYAYHAPARYSLFTRRDALARAWYHVKRSILSSRFAYRHLGGSISLGRVASKLPFLERKATFSLDVLLPRFVSGGSLLEVGCGAGMYLDLMRALGWSRVAGVDTSAVAAETVQTVLGLEAHCGPLEAIGFPAGAFDFVAASHTLEHVLDPISFLAEVHRILKGGGTMALVVPNLGSLGFRRYGAAWYHLDAPRHMSHFTCSSLQGAVERAGFRVRAIRTSARAAVWTALFSRCIEEGETQGFWLPGARWRWSQRLRAAAFSMVEHASVACGAPLGEEIHVIAERR